MISERTWAGFVPSPFCPQFPRGERTPLLHRRCLLFPFLLDSSSAEASRDPNIPLSAVICFSPSASRNPFASCRFDSLSVWCALISSFSLLLVDCSAAASSGASSPRTVIEIGGSSDSRSERSRSKGPVKMFYAGYGYRGSNFEQTYRCYPASFFDKPHLEGGDKVIMPPSALDRLASLHIEYPMLFELHNGATERISHCGVLEFVAEEGMIIMPYWMMQNMLLQEGDTVRVKNATLPKGTYVKLQPHTTDFLDISNPKAILEKTLRNFSCLTTGDSIMVAYNNKQYYIDIVEAKPASAVSIIETDCEVDFAPPLDYKEPEKPQQPIVPASKELAEDQDANVEDEPKFKPFTGSGKRLDGKGSKQQAPEVPSAARSAPSDSNKRANQQTAAPSGASTSTRQKTGKLVFGSSASNNKEAQAQKEPVKGSEPPKKDEPKFHAFTGKSYSLKR